MIWLCEACIIAFYIGKAFFYQATQNKRKFQRDYTSLSSKTRFNVIQQKKVKNEQCHVGVSRKFVILSLRDI